MFSKGCAASNLKGTASKDCTDRRVTAKICARCVRVLWVLACPDLPTLTAIVQLDASVQNAGNGAEFASSQISEEQSLKMPVDILRECS